MTDLRLALRSLLKNPGFTTMAVVTLALGVGLTTTVFAVLDTVLLRPLPYANADRLVMIWHEYPTRDFGLVNLSYATVDDLASQGQSFEHIGAFSFQEVTVEGTAGPERLRGMRITGDLLARLGTPPLRGRHFSRDDEAPDATRTAILSYDLWQTRFGGSASLPGGTVTLDGLPHVVVGIMPATFTFPPSLASRVDAVATGAERPAFWTPLTARTAPPRREQRALLSLATLKPGVTLDTARAEVAVIARQLAGTYPEAYTDLGLTVIPLHEQVAGSVRPALAVLFGAVSFLVAIACVNIGNLLLTRAVARRKDVAVRLALGAGRWRLARYLLAESLWISLGGAVLGLLAARGALHLLLVLDPARLPRLSELGLHPEVVTFALGLSLLCGAFFSLAPLLQTVTGAVMPALQSDGANATAGGVGQITRRLLSAAQIAFALVLLTGAALMLQTLQRLASVDPGFDPERLLTLQLFVAPTVAREVPARVALHEQIVENLRALPGVVAAGSISQPPLSPRGDSAVTMVAEGTPLAPGEEGPQASYRPASVDYFRTMGIPLLRGRTFTALDGADAPGVVIVNDALAQRLWPGLDPVGRRLRRNTDNEWLTVVGVVGAVRQDGPASPVTPEAFRPYAQEPGRSFTAVLRTRGEPTALAAAARAAVGRAHPAVPVSRVLSMDDAVHTSVSWPRLTTSIFGTFAALALLLAVLGVYSTVSHSVASRTREVGLRLALGASYRDVLRLVVREELLPMAVGVVLGIAGARALARVMQGLVFGVSPTDPMTLGVAALFLLLAAALACAVPAHRAAGIDPLVALRAR